MLNEPGIYDIPLSEYVADPAPVPSLSASVANVLLSESPRHAWNRHPKLNPAYEHDDTAASDLGTIGHAILLEGDYSKIAVIEADDWKTKAAREARDLARSNGQTPVLACKLPDIEAMVKSAQAKIADSELASLFTKDGGESERTLLWQDEGIWMRSRPDRLAKDRRVIADLKFTGTSAEPNAFTRHIISYGYDIQLAMGQRGIMALCGPYDCTFVFIVVETVKPYVTSLIGLSPSFVSFAHDKLGRAIKVWKECLDGKRWPGYSDSIVSVEPPQYAVNQFAERYIIPEGGLSWRP